MEQAGVEWHSASAGTCFESMSVLSVRLDEEVVDAVFISIVRAFRTTYLFQPSPCEDGEQDDEAILVVLPVLFVLEERRAEYLAELLDIVGKAGRLLLAGNDDLHARHRAV